MYAKAAACMCAALSQAVVHCLPQPIVAMPSRHCSVPSYSDIVASCGCARCRNKSTAARRCRKPGHALCCPTVASASGCTPCSGPRHPPAAPAAVSECTPPQRPLALGHRAAPAAQLSCREAPAAARPLERTDSWLGHRPKVDKATEMALSAGLRAEHDGPFPGWS